MVEGGRIIVPAPFRKAMGIGKGDVKGAWVPHARGTFFIA